MNAKHTPGPWNVEFDTIYTGDPTKQPSRDTVVAQAAHRGFGQDEWAERLANARLIAASPELLSALREAFRRHAFGEDGPIWSDATYEKASAAIKKATGAEP